MKARVAYMDDPEQANVAAAITELTEVLNEHQLVPQDAFIALANVVGLVVLRGMISGLELETALQELEDIVITYIHAHLAAAAGSRPDGNA